MEEFSQKKGGLRIVLAPSFELTEINSALEKRLVETFPTESIVPLVDGFMFYHKEAEYQEGTTPLVGWLKPEHIEDQFPNARLHLVRVLLSKNPNRDLRNLKRSLSWILENNTTRLMH